MLHACSFRIIAFFTEFKALLHKDCNDSGSSRYVIHVTLLITFSLLEVDHYESLNQCREKKLIQLLMSTQWHKCRTKLNLNGPMSRKSLVKSRNQNIFEKFTLNRNLGRIAVKTMYNMFMLRHQLTKHSLKRIITPQLSAFRKNIPEWLLIGCAKQSDASRKPNVPFSAFLGTSGI